MPANLDSHGAPASFFLPETTTPAELHAFIKGFLARRADSWGSFPTGPKSLIRVGYEDATDCFNAALFESEEKDPLRVFRICRDRIEELGDSDFEISRDPGLIAWIISAQLRAASVLYYREKEAERARVR